MNTTGIIFNVQRFSIHDGPGIRTTVFLKGCPLNCIWCHNPEGKSFQRQIFFDATKCIGCGFCSPCPQKAHQFQEREHIYQRERCVACGECVENCPSEALQSAGKTVTPQDLVTEVLRDEVFFQKSGGGLTLSGGEPMAQPAFVKELVQLAKEKNLSVCIETSGFCKKEDLLLVAPYIDLFLYDYKTTPEQHLLHTGVPSTLILQNLALLDSLEKNIILRCPIIPQINDTPAHIAGIIAIVKSLHHVTEIDLEPYHPLGISKSERLGIPPLYNNAAFMSQDTLKQYAEQIQQETNLPVKL